MELPTKVFFEPKAREEWEWWKDNDLNGIARIKDLIKAIKQRPFEGIGKPEPLKYQKQGYWSRRINKADRLVYKVSGDTIYILSCKHHYGNQ